VLLWINGAFGVGKTTTAALVRELDARWRVFDPEWVGYMLRANLAELDVRDFQDLAPWRTLVPAVAEEIANLTGDDLLVVQTVLVEPYWDELHRGLRDRDLTPFHVVLDADEETLRARIRDDQVERVAASWRADHVAAFGAARPWLVANADLVVDTATSSAEQAAQQIVEASPR
jgi:hypothetical protein